jgi:hypothetical protein
MAYTPNKDRAVKGGVAQVSAKELADFRKQYGEKMGLRDLLNADKGLERKGEKTNYPQVEPKVRNKVTPDQVSRVARAVGVMEPENIPGPTRRTSDENMEATSETFKRGGKVSSASKRADGIAQKGKTKGTMIMCGGGMTKGKR